VDEHDLGNGIDAGRVDVSALSLPELLRSDDSVLTNCLRRVVADLDSSAESYAAFGNTP
jgi:FXSXX-COOH protein